MLTIENKITSELRQLERYLLSSTVEFPGWVAKRSRYLEPGKYETIDKKAFPLEKGTKIGDKGITVFLKNSLTLDESYKGKRVAILLNERARRGNNRTKYHNESGLLGCFSQHSAF